MSRRLRSGAPRLLACHLGSTGKWYDRHVRELRDRLGPFDGVSLAYAGSVAALWIAWRDAARDLDETMRKRQQGKGRRPSTSQVDRARRRAGLAWSDYDGALKRLEELAKGNGHGPKLQDYVKAKYGGTGDAKP